MTGRQLIVNVLLIFLVMMTGCIGSSQRKTAAGEDYVASLYNPSKPSLDPDYFMHHENERFSTLYIRAYPSQLRFSEANEESEYRAMLLITYRLLSLDENWQVEGVVDSSAVTYKLRDVDEKRPAFFASLAIPVPMGRHFLLQLEATDLVRGTRGLDYVYVDKRSLHSAQQFKVVSSVSGYPKFMPFFNPNEHFSIHYSGATTDSLFVSRFRTESALPRPPLNAPGEFKAVTRRDTLLAFAKADTLPVDYREEGLYFIQSDTLGGEGISLYNFGSDFPRVKTPTDLLEPIFYLSTIAEYRRLLEEPNRKLAVDNFWLKLGGNIPKSRELIRVYYNRVVYSNLYFTTYTEGWKTDRGMIFILFGPPNRIQVTEAGENWIYYSRRGGDLVEFFFERKPDPHCNYRLDWVRTTRSQSARAEAISSWRRGKVFSKGS